MVEMHRLAAIDIGSNAIRMLVANVIDDAGTKRHKKVSLVRVPIRLGQDVFETGSISDDKSYKLYRAIKGFKNLIDAYDVKQHMACATSAMREAQNGAAIVEKIANKTGINIEIITGQREADLILGNRVEQDMNVESAYLYIDVGGGSTEITLFENNEVLTAHSFNIGTVRMLQGKVASEELLTMRRWLKKITKDHKPRLIIGSGGNINKLIKMSQVSKHEKIINFSQLHAVHQYVKSYSYEERISRLDLNPDRADVIIPAAELYINAMEWANCDKIYVPKIGLTDGMIRSMYQ